MSMRHVHQPHAQWSTLEEARERVLATAPPFPRYEDMVIDGLTDDEEERFLTVISDG